MGSFMRCHQCGVDSALEDLFTRQRRSWSSQTYALCPPCRERRITNWSLFTFLLVFFISLIALLELAIHPDGVLPPGMQPWATLLNLELFWFLAFVCIVPHELGHATMAWLVGFRICRIGLGRGRRLLSLYVRGIHIDIRSVPALNDRARVRATHNPREVAAL
jgi:hypothetical protein